MKLHHHRGRILAGRAAGCTAKLLWPTTMALLLTLAADTSAHATNLLANPGAESGVASPWTMASVFGASVTRGIATGSTTVGDATLQATEGTRWFSGDGTANSVGSSFSGYLKATQRVDVRNQSIDTVRFGGDGFAAGQVLSGAGTLRVWHRHILLFYNSSLGFLGVDDISAQGGPQAWKSVANLATSSLSRSYVSAVPVGTAYIDFIQQYDLQAFAASGMTYRVVAGLDNAALEVVSVPEQSSMAMAVTGLASGSWLLLRRHRQRHV